MHYQILLDQGMLSAIHHSLNRVLEFVGAGSIFEMTPETFDRVQIRAIGWQQITLTRCSNKLSAAKAEALL